MNANSYYNSYGDDLVQNQGYKYPPCWDYCQYCRETAIIVCQDCINCQQITKTKILNRQLKPIQKQAQQSQSKTPEMGMQGYHGKVRPDTPDKLIYKCFQSESIKFFETFEPLQPMWIKTLEEYNELMESLDQDPNKPL